jgi:hypothetical protein
MTGPATSPAPSVGQPSGGVTGATRASWPELPWRDWGPTISTLHMWLQIVGKVRLALAPPPGPVTIDLALAAAVDPADHTRGPGGPQLVVYGDFDCPLVS